MCQGNVFFLVMTIQQPLEIVLVEVEMSEDENEVFDQHEE